MYVTNSNHTWIKMPKETPKKDLMKGFHHLHKMEILSPNLYLFIVFGWSTFTLKFLQLIALLYHFLISFTITVKAK